MEYVEILYGYQFANVIDFIRLYLSENAWQKKKRKGFFPPLGGQFLNFNVLFIFS